MKYLKIPENEVAMIVKQYSSTRDDANVVFEIADNYNDLKRRNEQTEAALREIAEGAGQAAEWDVVSSVEMYRPHPCRYEQEHLWVSVIQTPFGKTERQEAVRPAVIDYVRRYFGSIYEGPRGDGADEAKWNAAEVLEVLIGWQQDTWQANVTHRHPLIFG